MPMIELALITSLKILAIHVCCWQNMVFGWIRPALHWLPEFIKKPLYLCVICMSSVWGTFFWFEYHIPGVVTMNKAEIMRELSFWWAYAEEYVFFILTVCGINVILSMITGNHPENPINQDI